MGYESEKSFPFDAVSVNGVLDRRYHADDFARYFRSFISSGMFMENPDNLQVIANGDMSVTLRPGKIIIDGYRYDNIADIVIRITPADGVLNRIDRISLTWDKNLRDIHCVVREGVKSYDAVAPVCRRNAEYLDYVTADIKVNAGAISISQADIIDQRLNTEVCGLAIPFSKINTTTLYNQIQADLRNFRTGTQADILKWYEGIKNQLEGDVALNILNQIGTLSSLKTTAKDNLVAAINNLKDILDINNVASLRRPSFATLKEFVVATNKNNLVPNMFTFKDTGGWGPKGYSTWYRCIVIHQNGYATGVTFSVGANALFLTDQNELYLGIISGTKDEDNLSIKYKAVSTDISFLDTAAAIKANTASGKGAGALGVKGIYNEFKNELTANNKQFYFDYKNGKYGFNTDPNRGADTFVPFSNFSSMSIDMLWGIANATASNATVTLNYGNINAYKALILGIGELSTLYAGNVYGSYGATGIMVLSTEDFIRGTQLKSSYQTYNATISYLSNTQIRATYALASNRQCMLLGIK
ncbi:MAG: hypothetical protein ACI4DQ_09460 [Lachnospiraceae bacterium]